MIHPTPRAVFWFAAGIPLAVVLLLWDASLWVVALAYALIILAAIGLDALRILPERLLDVGFRVPPRLFVGEPGAVVLDIATARPNEAVRFEALCEISGGDTAPRPVAGVTVEGRLQLEPALVSFRRGRLTLDAIWLRYHGPLGLVERRSRNAIDLPVDIVPDVRGIQSTALQFFSRDAIHGTKVQRHRGEGSEFETLREYAPGLDHRFIDWKRSARHRKLLTREFRAERNNPMVLAFDTGHLMLEPINGVTRLDHAIAAGLLLGWISLRSGDQVGAYAFDAKARHYLQPVGGMPAFARLQRSGAALAYNNEETNFTLGLAELDTRLNRRTLVILFTEFVDTISAELLLESLQRMARRHLVVFVTFQDPMLGRLVEAPPERFGAVAEAVIAHDFLRERSIVLERIARLGVHCLDVPVGKVSVELLNKYLLIRQRGLA